MTSVLEPSETDQLRQILLNKLALLGEPLSEELKSLRSLILDYHALAEELLVSILVKDSFSSAHNFHPRHGYNAVFNDFRERRIKEMGEYNLPRLMGIALKIGVITEEQYEDLRCLNLARVSAAHPRTHKFFLYHEEERQKWILEIIDRSIRDLAHIETGYGITDFPLDFAYSPDITEV